jgi:uracil-DNA glycosylase family 4
MMGSRAGTSSAAAAGTTDLTRRRGSPPVLPSILPPVLPSILPPALPIARDAAREVLAAARDAIASCELCPRLRSYCRRIAVEKKAAHRDDVYWGRPVPGFGDQAARLLVVGLAPAAHGANRTGRVFTGDGSGDFLMRAMHGARFASIPTARHAGDGLALEDAYILSVVRCAPPDNKPTPDEIVRCRVHLRAESAALPRIRVVVALGKIAWDGYLAFIRQELRQELREAATADAETTGAKAALARRPAFAHGAEFALGAGRPTLIGSYHPSRQNTNTGRLTPAMLDAVFARARRLVDEGSRA